MLKSKPETQSLQLLRGFRLSVGRGLCRRPLSPFWTKKEGLNLDPFWSHFGTPFGSLWELFGAKAGKQDAKRLRLQ